MMELLGTISGVMAIAGVILNNYMNRGCFYIWLVSNAISAGLHVNAGMWSLAGRDIIFIGLALHGLYKWSGKEDKTGTITILQRLKKQLSANGHLGYQATIEEIISRVRTQDDPHDPKMASDL